MIAFNKYYNKFNVISSLLVVVSLLLLIFKGLNFGIDFKGGTLIELRSTDTKINVSSLRDNLSQMNLGDISVKNFGNENDYLIKFEKKDKDKNLIQNIKKDLTKENLIQLGLISKKNLIKVLGRGELKGKVKVSAHKFTASAKSAIEAAGGEAINI